MPIMAGKPKGFGDLLKQQKKSPKTDRSEPQFQIIFPDNDGESTSFSDVDEQELRIGAILGLDSEEEIPYVEEETLKTYQNYLQQHLELPCTITGIEDFSWEEYYVIGGGSKQEHDRLRKIKPSYLDTYELLGFNDELEEFYGLLVSVKRLSDKKKFILPLSDLTATDKKSKNYQLLDDYSFWFVNWR
jgi:hypothetical protein